MTDTIKHMGQQISVTLCSDLLKSCTYSTKNQVPYFTLDNSCDLEDE